MVVDFAVKTKPKIPWKAKGWKKRENKQDPRLVGFIKTCFSHGLFCSEKCYHRISLKALQLLSGRYLKAFQLLAL